MDALAWLGILAASGAAATALVSRDPRLRAGAMLLALALAPVLVAGDVWDTERFRALRDSPSELLAVAAVGLAAVAAVTALTVRVPVAFPLLAFGTLAFRVPVELGGETSHLLVPLYLVIAGGAVASLVTTVAEGKEPLQGDGQPRDARTRSGRSGKDPLGGDGEPRDARTRSGARRGTDSSRLGRGMELATRGLPWLVAAFLVLYALQSAYSSDLSKATETVAFFLVPFAVLFTQLLEVRWTRRLLGGLLVLVVAEALAMVAIGVWQWGDRDLFWNPSVIAGNEVHTYFRVNSVFWDPNIFGRYLVLAILTAAAYMVWTRRSGRAVAAAIAAGVLIVGLTLTYSQSSVVALLAGLVVVIAPRWGTRWALAGGVVVVIGAIALALIGGVEPTSERSLDVRSSGRVTLVRGGLELVGERPAFGYGSGAFQEEFAQRNLAVDEPADGAISHSEPITVAAEQGAVGVALFGALLLAGLVTLLRAAPGMPAARTALVAGFVAMIVHSLAYASLLIDPVTWALLGLGLALARAPALAPTSERVERVAPEPAPRVRPSLASPGTSSSTQGS